MVSAPFQTLYTTLNSVVSIASKSVYGQEWGQNAWVEQPQKDRGEKIGDSKTESPIKEKLLLIEKAFVAIHRPLLKHLEVVDLDELLNLIDLNI